MPAGVCEVEGCERPHEARGWCKAHYERWRKYGDPLASTRAVRGGREMEGWERRHYAKGWCRAHYERWSKHGDALVASTRAAGGGWEGGARWRDGAAQGVCG